MSRQLEIDRRNEALAEQWLFKRCDKREYVDARASERLALERHHRRKILAARLWMALECRRRPPASANVIRFRGRAR
jgi:hypothetical protein